MFFLVIIIFLLAWLSSDIYLWCSFVRNAALLWKVLYWLPTLFFVVLIILSIVGVRISMTLWLIALIFCLQQILCALFSVVGRLASLAWHPAFPILNWTGAIISWIFLIVLLYGMVIGWKVLNTNKIDLEVTGLPASFDGYRIVHLSDFHVGTHGHRTKYLESLVRTVNESHPDLIAFTGDLVNIKPSELDPFMATLSTLSAPDGVMSVMGNHDYCFYGHKKGEWVHDCTEVRARESELGWTLLNNEHRYIHRGKDSIAIAGVEYCGGMHTDPFVDFPAAMQGIPDSTFILLLDHNPAHWKMEVVPDGRVALTLSGHTHAAQLKIGKWSPAQWLYKEWSGLYQEGKQKLYVSEGCGGTVPFRFGTKPEVVIITLHPEER